MNDSINQSINQSDQQEASVVQLLLSFGVHEGRPPLANPLGEPPGEPSRISASRRKLTPSPSLIDILRETRLCHIYQNNRGRENERWFGTLNRIFIKQFSAKHTLTLFNVR